MNVSLRTATLLFGSEWTTTYWSHFTLKAPGHLVDISVFIDLFGNDVVAFSAAAHR